MLMKWLFRLGLMICLFYFLVPFCQAFYLVDQTIPQARRLNPKVVYNSKQDEYLAVWTDKRNDIGNLWDQKFDYGFPVDGDIYGQRFKEDGTLLGREIKIFEVGTSRDEQYPSIIYNSKRNEYVVFVSRTDDRVTTNESFHTGPCYNITAQRVSAAGERLGKEFVVADANGCQWYPRPAYNPDDDVIMVTYHDFRNFERYLEVGKEIFGRVISYDASGNLVGTGEDFFVTRTIGQPTKEAYNYQQYSDVAYDSTGHKFMVVWSDDREHPYVAAHIHAYDIYGQYFDGQGKFLGENFLVYGAELNQHFPVAAYNVRSKKFFNAWLTDEVYGASEVYEGRPEFLVPPAMTSMMAGEQSQKATRLTLACSGRSGDCLLSWAIWDVGRWQGSQVVGQKINRLGELQPEMIKISPDREVGVGIPSVVYGKNKFVAVYEVNRPTSFGNIAVATINDNYVPGDANLDKKVDLLDLKDWKTEYISKSGLTADFNMDEKVDLLDLKIWKTGYLK